MSYRRWYINKVIDDKQKRIDAIKQDQKVVELKPPPDHQTYDAIGSFKKF